MAEAASEDLAVLQVPVEAAEVLEADAAAAEDGRETKIKYNKI